jgi:hypothetical protein
MPLCFAKFANHSVTLVLSPKLILSSVVAMINMVALAQLSAADSTKETLNKSSQKQGGMEILRRHGHQCHL